MLIQINQLTESRYKVSKLQALCAWNKHGGVSHPTAYFVITFIQDVTGRYLRYCGSRKNQRK